MEISDFRFEMQDSSNFQFLAGGPDAKLDVVHQMTLVASRSPDQFFESDVIKDIPDGSIDLGPDRFELAGILFSAIICKVTGIQTRKLNEGPTHCANHVTHGNLTRRAAQGVASFGSAAASDDIDPLQDLHDLKEKLHGNVLPLRDILYSNGGLGIVVQGQFQYGGAGILVSSGNLHDLLTDDTLCGPNLSLLPRKLGHERRPEFLSKSKTHAETTTH